MAEVTVSVDGVKYSDHVEPRLLLVHYLREVVGKTGTPVGCDTSNCGACTVLLNGESVKSCAVLTVQADGAEVTTIEGVNAGGPAPGSGELSAVQAAFREHHALQCGFCTPGMLIAAQDLLRSELSPDRERIREHLSGNYCRCTGYQAIVDAVETTAKSRANAAQAERTP